MGTEVRSRGSRGDSSFINTTSSSVVQHLARATPANVIMRCSTGVSPEKKIAAVLRPSAANRESNRSSDSRNSGEWSG